MVTIHEGNDQASKNLSDIARSAELRVKVVRSYGSKRNRRVMRAAVNECAGRDAYVQVKEQSDSTWYHGTLWPSTGKGFVLEEYRSDRGPYLRYARTREIIVMPKTSRRGRRPMAGAGMEP